MKGDATERRVECGEKGGKKEVQKERKKERKKKQKTKRATKHTDMTIVRRFCGFFFSSAFFPQLFAAERDC